MWTRAWFAGAVAPDDVLDAVAAGDAPHTVEGVAGLGTLLDLLAAFRRENATVRLVLPAAGDVRGLPGPADFRTAALEAGEGVVCGRLGAVPSVVEYYPSSAPPTVTWLVSAVEPVAADFVQLQDAQYDLTTAIRESATVLAAADVGRWRDELGAALRDARRAGERLVLPPDYPPRAVALLAQAERMQAVLDLAADDPVGAAVDQHGVAVRAGALRPLATTIRRARLAAYNATAD